MQDSTFIQQLKRELPLWVQQGFVKPQYEQPILNSVMSRSEQEKPIGFIVFTVVWIGILFLAAGILTFFAINWGGMQPIAKVQILIGSLWVMYLLAGLFSLIEKTKTIGKLCLFVGVVIFGTDIFLITHLYDIKLHYPTGVLIWSCGALLTAYFMHSQPVLIMGILLATLWTAMEMFDFQHSVHWSFLPLWLLFLYPILEGQWTLALKVALTSLCVWSLFVMALYVGDIFFIQIYFLICLAVFLLAEVLKTYEFTARFSKTIQHFSYFFGTLSLFALTFTTNIAKERGLFFDIVPTFGYTETMGAIGFVIFMMIWIAKRSNIIFNTTSFISGQGLLFLLLLIVLINTHLGSAVEQHKVLIATAYNVLFFLSIGWIVYVGTKERDPLLVNFGFIYLAAGILCRFFESFWTYPNRSLFFIAAGLLFTFGSIFLEKQRRTLIGSIERGVENEA